MACITSRGYTLPINGDELTGRLFFNLWQIRLWPCRELVAGDTLYFYESTSQRLVWKTKVADVLRFTYSDKTTAAQQLTAWSDDFNPAEDYFKNARASGYCLAFTVHPVEKLNIPKPKSLPFPQQGWLRLDNAIAQTWFGTPSSEDTIDGVLDDIAPTGNITARLQQLSTKLAEVAPARVTALVTRTIRRDSQMVKALKSACDWRCQFPGCGVRIPTKSGGWYAEVAHIKPVAKGGLSVLGNLLVLCPNHHKEFDHGNLTITEQNVSSVKGILNGVPFQIDGVIE
jgi:hypothetical protein